MKSLLKNKKVKVTLLVVLILILLVLIISFAVNNVNKINKEQNEKLQANIDISTEVVGQAGKDENGRDLGKVTLNVTSDIPMDKIQIENVNGTIIQEDVNGTTYEKEINVVFGHTHIISVVTNDGKISMHKITKEKPPAPISNPSESSEIRTGNPLNFTWEEINEIAEIISNDSSINNNTQEFSLSYKGNNYTIGVGDYTTVNGYQVRIMGFNHDTLSSQDAYGAGKTNTYAGISFEFVECITTSTLHHTQYSTVGGWVACTLRSTLNGTTINSLENKEYIKQVNKKYIKTFNQANSVTISQDKLWLLSCSEVWNNGEKFDSSHTFPFGRAVAKEGEQYKYYKNINANTTTANSNLIKKNNGSAIAWWLRSPLGTDGGYSFCEVYSDGSVSSVRAAVYYARGVSPSFSI